ncbi:hypothetical protein DERF_004078 [Dermatophagoides farinae]|uniref:Uncharacterized protein n=1 Tax=Dermatophagoides farinae TaxID=6954 RepID=A0A922LDS2_DERFA|nr:hypothetical protein DERF_004078 [Dermatophagoides farinae]
MFASIVLTITSIQHNTINSRNDSNGQFTLDFIAVPFDRANVNVINRPFNPHGYGKQNFKMLFFQ